MKRQYLNTHRLSLLLLLFLLATYNTFGQSPGYRNFNVKDGLPSSEVYDCIQDSKGFMWFGTDKGVCRFDGYEFKTYSTSDGLADNTVFECKEDYKGRIWFRSLSGKLSYFFNDSIFRLAINDSISKLVKASLTESIAIDTLDNIFMGFYGYTGGIVRVNLKHNSISVIPLPIDRAYILLLQGNKVITGNTCQPFFLAKKIPAPNKSLSLYALLPGDSAIRKVQQWEWDIPQKMLIHDQSIMLRDGKIAASVNSDFVILDTLKPENIMINRLDNEIVNLNEDKENNIWLSTQRSPLYFVNGTLTDKHLPSFIQKNHVTSITTDSEGGTWFTSLYGGVYYVGSLNLKTYSTDNGLPGNKIMTVSVTKDGTIWTASEHSNKINIIHNDSIFYRLLPDIEGLSITNVLLRDNNEAWISNNSIKGLIVFENNNSFKMKASISESGYTCLIPDTGENCWAVNYSMLVYVKKTGDKIVCVRTKSLDQKIFSICKSPDNILFAGTIRGLWAYKNDSLINYGNKNNLLKNRIDELIESKSGDLWIATRDTGIIVMQKNNKLVQITKKEGLLSNFCQCLCTDYRGNVWIGTNQGISHILLNKTNQGKLIDTIINLTAPNLIEVNKIISKGDTIYAATNNGLTMFDMNKVSYNKVPPSVYITSVKINNKSWPISSTYNLHYDENYFFISFVGLTYKDAGNTQYRYKMEGIDTGWIYTKNRDVQYPKLAPGNYTFFVSAMNNDGLWNQKATSLQINISPPFWATWWARSLFIAAIAGFIYWRFKVVELRAKKEADINKQLIIMELRELKAQMDPHFLFNNLNTLTHLVELKSDDAPEFVEELSKYYRYSLQFRNAEFTALENELKQAERYIHILKIRFGDNMKIQWNIDETLRSYYIATYSLQLLLENITKHNIVSAAKPIWVEISTTEQNSLLVKNQFQPKNSSALSNGHGLKSINQRYQLLTKRKTTINQTTEYFCVELPLITPEEYENTYS